MVAHPLPPMAHMYEEVEEHPFLQHIVVQAGKKKVKTKLDMKVKKILIKRKAHAIPRHCKTSAG